MPSVQAPYVISNMPYVINISDVLHEDFGESRKVTFNFPLELEENEAKIIGGVTGEVQCTRISDTSCVGKFKSVTTVSMPCIRCLKPADVRLPMHFISVFSAYREEDQFDIFPDSTIDISLPLTQEILLNLPLKPLCNEHSGHREGKKTTK